MYWQYCKSPVVPFETCVLPRRVLVVDDEGDTGPRQCSWLYLAAMALS
jgi:hypothetical protein